MFLKIGYTAGDGPCILTLFSWNTETIPSSDSSAWVLLHYLFSFLVRRGGGKSSTSFIQMKVPHILEKKFAHILVQLNFQLDKLDFEPHTCLQAHFVSLNLLKKGPKTVILKVYSRQD